MSLDDSEERNRILMQYMGVFKLNAIEFAEKIIKPVKKVKNWAR
jgi:hypothetical protein